MPKLKAALLGALACMSVVVGQALAAPVAHTQNGPVTGVAANGMREFLGIRYAAPPVGALRWQPPQPVPQAMTTHDATSFGAFCAQPPSAYGLPSTNEDCLYLNVYTPKNIGPAEAAKLPVMVWIHGGALLVGLSNAYDPAPLVSAGNVIVVTLNYRLGYFGFLATSGLDAEGHPAANYGLQDQQFAMDWVRRNIAGFGGDPDRITIFGESAGGLSVLSNLASPTAHGLFNGAIVQSGAYALTLPTLAQAEAGGAAIASAIGCAPADTACLRAATPEQIIASESSAGLSVTTIVDGTTLPLSLGTALKTGQFNRVPVINGSNHDEYRQFLAAEAGLTAAQYPAVLAGLYGPTFGAAVAAKYPVGSYNKPVLALAAAITDQVFACTAREVDRLASAWVPVYGYEFNDRHAPEDFLPPAGFNFGASHASELQFLFDLPKLSSARPFTPAETRLSARMAAYWTGFARTGSPDRAGLADWRTYARGSDQVQSLAPEGVGPEGDFAAVHHCGFWAPVIRAF